MSNERPDNEIAWGEKLENPEAISPEPWTGKGAAWEKLYSRLHEKPRRRMPFWYWAAAACLLGVVYLAVRPGSVGQGKEGAGRQDATGRITGERMGAGRAAVGARRVAAGGETETKGSLRTSGQTAMGTENGTTVILNERPVAAVRKIGKSVAIGRPAASRQPIAVSSDNPPQANTAPVAMDTTITLAKLVVPPVRKKLRVVSINELSDPGPEAGMLAANSATNEKNNKSSVGYTRKHTDFGGTPFFRLIPSRNPSLSNTTAATENTHYQLVKIKLSPQN